MKFKHLIIGILVGLLLGGGGVVLAGKWSDYPICVRYITQELGWKVVGRKREWPLYSFSEPEKRHNVVKTINVSNGY